ncbi:MAG: hypothetical protein C5B51_30965 [Terriglobia bacterium]|nr:MAG: hypothetical protein C5B51_30965 [Terriglobia bacterium]
MTALPVRHLVVPALLAAALFTNQSTAEPVNRGPSEQQVLAFLADTVDWYRHLPASQRIGTEPADLLFLETNRPITTEIVRLSFEFGKAIAAVNGHENSIDQPESAAGRELHDLLAAKARLDASTTNAVDRLNSVTQARLTAHHTDWKRLDSQLEEIRSRIKLLKTMSSSCEELLNFVRTASAQPDGVTNMTALVESLERTVPGVSIAALPTQASNFAAESLPAAYGIVGMISRTSAIARKQRIVDGLIERTDALAKSLQNVRMPLIEPFRKELSTFSLDPKSLDQLQRQQSRLTDLVAEAKTVSPAVAALTRQGILLGLYRSRLAEWRSEIQMEGRTTWKTLIMRLVALGGAIVMLRGTGVLVRRLTHSRVHDPDKRSMLLIGERVLVWMIAFALIFSSFAFDVSSLATFLGLLSAGLAVGLHDVLLAIGGYVVIVRRFRVRLGDRIQIAGVTGEVTNLGLLQFDLGEIDSTTGRRTGRVVSFSNSYVFVSPATPLFRTVEEVRTSVG